jgi:hypothetical protein
MTDKPSGRNPARPRWRLSLNGTRYGPSFFTRTQAEAFKEYVEDLHGVEWTQHSPAALERLAEEFRRKY